ncbi:MAG TPA: anti-sigma factor [Steroidobacteraceae bacterium]
MANANSRDGRGDGKSKVTSLRDLPESIQPPRDLWAGIEARINADRQSSAEPVQSPVTRRPAHMRWLAAAAMIGTLAVGVWIGRSILPSVGPTPPSVAANNPTIGQQPSTRDTTALVQAAYLSDPKFRATRDGLVKSLSARLASLPPESRAKVVDSLATIHKSMQDLEAALGKDPTNALLQELLLNTYQDEMRVLTTVHEASESGRGI